MAKGLMAVELRTASEEDLDTKLAEAKIELFNLRFQAATGQLESHGRLRAVRREIARIYTVKRERELGIIRVEEEFGEGGDDVAEAAEAPAAGKAADKEQAPAAPASESDTAASSTDQPAPDEADTEEADEDE
jgi:large subunit ribosomal protein L29